MKYTYFQTAIIAAVDSIGDVFSKYQYVANSKRHQPFPVYIANTGDESFMSMISDRLHIKPKSDTVHVPSMSLDINDIALATDARTNSTRNAKFVLSLNQVKSEKVKAMTAYPTKVTVNGVVLFSNIFQYLAFIEYIYNGVYKRQTFSFKYWGKYQESVWTLVTDQFDPEFDKVGAFGNVNDGSSHTMPIQFEVYLKYPSFGLNNTLGPNVDDDGDGINEGGIGGNNGPLPDTDQFTDASNTIKGVVAYTDVNHIDNVASRLIVGEVNDDLLKE